MAAILSLPQCVNIYMSSLLEALDTQDTEKGALLLKYSGR